MRPQDSTTPWHFRLALTSLVLALFGHGCFTSPNVDVGTIRCNVPDDCPAGYVCKYPGKIGGCCRPDDPACGMGFDGAPPDVAGPGSDTEPRFDGEQQVDGGSLGDGRFALDVQNWDAPAGGDGAIERGVFDAAPGEEASRDAGVQDAPIGGGEDVGPTPDAACVGGQACTVPGQPCRNGVLTCSAGVGICSDNGTKPETTPCDDGNACTTGESCHSGVCNGGTLKICVASDVCHAAGTCNPASGACSDPIGNEGGACADATTPCLIGRTCKGGVCTGGSQKVCPPSDSCHNPGTCDPATGNCSNPSASAGTTCGTNQVCDSGGNCVACTSGATCSPATCKTGVTSCSTGTSACSPTGNSANGTLCGTDGLCFNGACGSCANFVGGTSCGTNKVCKNGLCVTRLPNGNSCGLGWECGSGNCVRGWCCGSPSCGVCKDCFTGSCAAVPDGFDSASGCDLTNKSTC
jgi:hypothetical protein